MRVVRAIATLLVGLMLVGATEGRAQDDQRSVLAKVISTALSSPEGQVRIGAVDGPLSSNAQIRDIEISDREGPWLRVDSARLVWRRAALLSRRLEVEQLEIGRIEVLRKPVPAVRQAAGNDEPLLPELPVKVVVAAFSVGELVLGAPIAGSPARLAVTGNLSLGAPSEGLQAAIALRRRDRDGTSDLRLQFLPKGETLDLVLQHQESPGGLVAHVLDIKDRPAVSLDLQGRGPLDAWRAQLAFSAGDAGRATGRATITRQGASRRVELNIAGQVHGLLPPVAATIFSGETSITGQLDLADDGAIALPGLRLASTQAELTVAGTLGSDRRLDVQANARALPGDRTSTPRLAALSGLMLDVRARGTLDAPDIDGRIEAEISRLEAFADDLGLSIRGGAKISAAVKGRPLDRTLDASLAVIGRTLTFGNAQLTALLGSQAALSGKASLRGDRVAIENLALKARRVDAVLSGSVETAASATRGAITLAGKLDGRALSGQTSFVAERGGALDIASLDLRVAGGKVAGALKVAVGGLVTGAVSVDFPDLGQFSAALGTRLRGVLSAQATLTAPQGAQQAAIKAKGRGLSGFGAALASLDGEAMLHGDLARPAGTLRATLAGLQYPDLQRAGVPRLDIATTGALMGDRVRLDASVRGGGQIALKVSGDAPFSTRGGLGLKVTGTVDAALANSRLTGGAQRVAGRVALDASVRGTLAEPRFEGAAVLSNGSFSDLLQGFRLTNVSGRIAGAGTSLRVENVTAVTPGEGRIAVNGTVHVDPARGFPANLRVTGENARLLHNEVVRLVAGLDVAVTGPLASAPVVAGQVNVVSFDVTVPDRLPVDSAPLANAKHLSPPEQTRERLRLAEREGQRKARRKAGAAGNARLNLRIVAPSHIFVRGRGIDAELGGDIALSGPLLAPRANGAFELRRGQLSMLTQRLEFSRGRVTFLGDLIPDLDFTAATLAGSITAKVSVTGRADSPSFALTSEPQLPPDEVLSRLMFEQAVGSLSPLQAVQLAQAVARLTGRGGPDFLEKTRQALGVDTLDVTAGKDGPTVGASRYITRNIRLGVKAGATPEQSGVTANVDVGRRIKLQGETGASGKTSVGIAAEIEY
ncbi:MAG TPA: translocation/assembly module TamB domain-containing protein [Beijerinckiaceae bacterium]|nr:translocation/assembly module TamB domain-containing protein [Beijerinckiaceae bacterium]